MRSSVFGRGFWDGFTMGGFFNRLERPGRAVALCAPSVGDLAVGVVFEPEPGAVRVAGDLHSLPEGALRKMIDLLNREDEGRKHLSLRNEKALDGTSR